jgi:hypothetical protein
LGAGDHARPTVYANNRSAALEVPEPCVTAESRNPPVPEDPVAPPTSSLTSLMTQPLIVAVCLTPTPSPKPLDPPTLPPPIDALPPGATVVASFEPLPPELTLPAPVRDVLDDEEFVADDPVDVLLLVALLALLDLLLLLDFFVLVEVGAVVCHVIETPRRVGAWARVPVERVTRYLIAEPLAVLGRPPLDGT